MLLVSHGAALVVIRPGQLIGKLAQAIAPRQWHRQRRLCDLSRAWERHITVAICVDRGICCGRILLLLLTMMWIGHDVCRQVLRLLRRRLLLERLYVVLLLLVLLHHLNGRSGTIWIPTRSRLGRGPLMVRCE